MMPKGDILILKYTGIFQFTNALLKFLTFFMFKYRYLDSNPRIHEAYCIRCAEKQGPDQNKNCWID